MRVVSWVIHHILQLLAQGSSKFRFEKIIFAGEIAHSDYQLLRKPASLRGLSSRSFAALTAIVRPSSSVLSSSLIAVWAALRSLISTNAKPRERLVARSRTTATLVTSPYLPNASESVCSVVSKESFPMNIFVTIWFICLSLGLCNARKTLLLSYGSAIGAPRHIIKVRITSCSYYSSGRANHLTRRPLHRGAFTGQLTTV